MGTEISGCRTVDEWIAGFRVKILESIHVVSVGKELRATQSCVCV